VSADVANRTAARDFLEALANPMTSRRYLLALIALSKSVDGPPPYKGYRMKKLMLLVLMVVSSCAVEMEGDSSDSSESSNAEESAAFAEAPPSGEVAPIGILGCTWGCTGSGGETQSYWCTGDASCCVRHADACDSSSPL
jgi:hypothetical protein